MKKSVNGLILVAALGYFVDIYDLTLFGVVRKPSLEELGFVGDALVDQGVNLLNWQMLGMLVGGLIFGILGDKKGRLSVLFGSIFLYSVANIANGFVNDITTYSIVRFIAGIGLAGELGAGITLVVESMSKEKRGIGTMVVVVVGALGAVLGAVVSEQFGWRHAYFVGGGLGLLLLLLRIGAFESGMFDKLKKKDDVKRGDMMMIFKNSKRLKTYINSIVLGIPIWYAIGILIFYSPEIAKELGVKGDVDAGYAVMLAYIGLSVGDLISGVMSQLLKSRKKVVYSFITSSLILMLIYLLIPGMSSTLFYTLCFLIGAGTGYWAIFVTMSSEQFGTNLRSTVTTTVPNFVRGSVVPVTLLFKYLKGSVGIIESALIVGAICMAAAYIATYFVKETFHEDLDYIETL